VLKAPPYIDKKDGLDANDVGYLYEQLLAQYPYDFKNNKGETVLDFVKLLATKGKSPLTNPGKYFVHAVIDLGYKNENRHNDWVFSFRFVERNSDDFVIESETTYRDYANGPIIRPGYGGWIKYQNNVPVITRSDMKELMGEAEVMNVRYADAYNDDFGNDSKLVPPVSNEAVAEGVQVVGGTGKVTILNATGKNVVISSILGQTIANVTVKSDNVTIAVPAGIVVVAVEGESAVKTVVK
jgi:hypothetical protein